MTRRSAIEPTVPLSDLYQPVRMAGAAVAIMPPEDEQADHMQRTYGVAVVRDHANRLAVSLADAYKVRDARLAAESELHDDWMLEQRRAAQLKAWARSREEYWSAQWLWVMRATPIDASAANPMRKQIAAARHTLSVMVLEAEEKAGIPPEVQAQLSWPEPVHWFRGIDAGDRPEDPEFAYQPPAEEYR
jgi:hypothetical protein